MTVLLFLPISARAAQFSSPGANSDSVIIGNNQPHKDLYTVGNTVTSDTPVQGDLVVVGKSILIDGDVENSLFAVGQTLTFHGAVGHHLRIAGDTITISGHIHGDVLVAGSTVSIAKSAEIDGDLLVAAANTSIDGVVHGQAKIATTTLTINSGAVIAGDLNYYSPVAGTISPKAQVGATHFHSNQSKSNNFGSTWLFIQIIGWFLLTLLVYRLWPRTFGKMVERSFGNFWTNFGIGFLVSFILPFILIIMAATMIGLPIALAIGAVWLVVLVFGLIVGKLAVGSLIYKIATKGEKFELNLWVIVIGTVLIKILFLVPILDSIVTLLEIVFILVGIGVITSMTLKNRDEALAKID